MRDVLRYAGQAVVYLGIIAVIGYFADTPAYTHFPPDKAMIKIALAHGGQHKGGCREPTEEELARLPPNMRRKLICGRERLPVTVELEIDGETVYSRTLQPAGIRNDGPSRVYASFPVETGTRTVTARLRDSDRAEGFDYESSDTVTLAATQLYVIQFRPEAGGFHFR